MELKDHIRSVPDFPIPGILFRDITPLLGDAAALREAVACMAAPWRDAGIRHVAAMEARGFIFGAAIAIELGAGFVPVRKEGKLPWHTYSARYELEYRRDVLHVHRDAVAAADRVLVVDDLLATGGTAAAVIELIDKLGGKIGGVQFLIELVDLKGRDALPGYDVRSVIKFEGD